MKTSYSHIKSKISQAGSLMIEAMAMLALISLVTPTLYKKSAERTTELQDINTATHVRTVLKALDNYVKVNYQNLIAPDGLLKADGDVAQIDDLTADEYKAYFPYGYEFDDLKTFKKPRAALRRQGDSITSFVEFPSSFDYGEMRAARIASIVGSNGGYVNDSKEAMGVGGVWNLDQSDLGELGFSDDTSSIVVASSEAINSATTSALENEKYLQRTKVESEDQLWRNTMTTDLYMGNPKGDAAGDRYKILGVDQMIVGSVNKDYDESLVITDAAEGGGSAWLAGTFHALSDTFRLDDDGTEGRYSLGFGSESAPTIEALTDEKVAFNNGQVVFNNVGDDDTTPGAQFYVNTEIQKNLTVYGDTKVATNEGAIFQAGPDGSYLDANSSSVDILDGNITTTRGEDGERNTTVDTDLQVNGNTKMGDGDEKPTRDNWDMRLNVQGNAFVSNILEAGEIDTKKFKALEIHVGGEDYDQETWWLNATRDGVTIIDPDNDTERFSASKASTKMYSPERDDGARSELELDVSASRLMAPDELYLYTDSENGTVSLQEGAVYVSGHGSDANSQVDINAANTFVNGGTFNIHDGEEELGNSAFYVDPKHSNAGDGTGLVQMNANVTRVAPRDGGVFEVAEHNGDDNWDATGSKILRVSPTSFADAGAIDHTERGAAELDLSRFRLWDNESESGEHQSILTVQLDSNASGLMDNQNREDSRSSIYIRRGAIEVEPTSGGGASADQGWGYIEASRFVANNPPHGGTAGEGGDYIRPIFSTDYNTTYGQNEAEQYDRYMVNPAYTSVMHDIKLTTRGGARLSDILPDFINKGIYVVNNTYMEDPDISFGGNFSISKENGRLVIQGLQPASATQGGEWASPFLGVVPAPMCPPGHARVITITPASFLMAQAGQLTTEKLDKAGKRMVVDETAAFTRLGLSDYQPDKDEDGTVAGAQFMQKTLGSNDTIYYLGFGGDPKHKIGGQAYEPLPLYFQQSTWLKSSVLPYELNGSSPCNSEHNTGVQCGSNFAGWVTAMGFVYPGSLYEQIIRKIGVSDFSQDNFYWNVFPVRQNTLEAYATVYCYFDRNGIFGQTFDSSMVDTSYDQLKNFRPDKTKESNSYTNRLDDPTLKYKSPW